MLYIIESYHLLHASAVKGYVRRGGKKPFFISALDGAERSA
jgi:hypothetical protein